MAYRQFSVFPCQRKCVLPIWHRNRNVQINFAFISGKPNAHRVFRLNEQIQIGPNERLNHLHRKVRLVNVSRSVSVDRNGVQALPGEAAEVKIEGRAVSLKVQVPSSLRGNNGINFIRQISFASTHIVPSLGFILPFVYRPKVQCEKQAGSP